MVVQTKLSRGAYLKRELSATCSTNVSNCFIYSDLVWEDKNGSWVFICDLIRCFSIS